MPPRQGPPVWILLAYCALLRYAAPQPKKTGLDLTQPLPSVMKRMPSVSAGRHGGACAQGAGLGGLPGVPMPRVGGFPGVGFVLEPQTKRGCPESLMLPEQPRRCRHTFIPKTKPKGLRPWALRVPLFLWQRPKQLAVFHLYGVVGGA